MELTLFDVKLVKEKTVDYKIKTTISDSPTAVVEIVKSATNIINSTVEKFGMLCLDTKNVVRGIHILAIGEVNSCIVDIRGIMQRALLNNATSIIIFHNHPSGDCLPSNQDIYMTNKIKEACKIMTIHLLDHVIIGDEYYSFLEHKIL
jgi:DNA repair protein RadC